MPHSPTQPLITVVIPTFERAALLQRAIKSVQAQTYRDWRLLVVDNASTDSTEAVVVEFMSDTRITYHRQPHNIGLLANWSFAISSVTTEYFCILSDDDLVLPQFLEVTLDELERDTHLGMCVGATPCVDSAGYVVCRAPENMTAGLYPAGEGACAMVDGQHPSSNGALFRTECVQRAGGFNVAAHYLADVDLMLRVAMDCPITYLDDDVAFHMVHSGNTFNSDSCWFPGLVAVFEGIAQRKSTLGRRCSRDVFDRLIRTAVYPALRSFARSPLSSYRSSVWSDVLTCLRIANRTTSVLVIRFPMLMARGATRSFGRRIRALVSPQRVRADHRTQLAKHPLAELYLR